MAIVRSLLCCLLLLLGACTTPVVRADVTHFTILPPTMAGKSFTIIPDPPQVGSLEFQRYAEMVANSLTAKGWRAIPPGGEAETLVQIHWGLGPSRTVTWESPSSVGVGGMGWWGGPHHFHGAGVGMGVPFNDPFPYWETRSETYYPIWLNVEILDARAHRAGRRQVLFEGRAISERRRAEAALTMPALIQALFTDFPGMDGATVQVVVPAPGG